MIYIILKLRLSGKCTVLLHRLSPDDGLVALVAYILRIRYFVEINGRFDQDLEDRGRNCVQRKVSERLMQLNCFVAKKIFIVHENLVDYVENFTATEKCAVISNGVDIIEIAKVERKPHLKYVGYLGSHARREGVDILADVFTHLPEHYRMVCVGGTESECALLLDNFKRNGLEDRLEIHTNQDRATALSILSAVDVCVHFRRPIAKNTLSQGMPLKILDYMLLGKPIVTTRLDNMLFIEENEFGLLSEFSPEDFALKIREVLSGNIAFENLNNRSLRYVEAHYSWRRSLNLLRHEIFNA